MDFSAPTVVYDIKVGRCSQLNEYMKLYEYQNSRSFIDLGPDLSDTIFLNFFSSITTRLIEAKFHMEPPWDGGMKAYYKQRIYWFEKNYLFENMCVFGFQN